MFQYLFLILIFQISTTSPLPKHCVPGDLFDAYGPPSKCVALNEWEEFPTMKTGVSYPMVPVSDLPWHPDCSWAFQDKKHRWHCPYETASGQVVGCASCSGRYAKNLSCIKWLNRCQKRVELMAGHQTVEPSIIDPKETVDHSSAYHWRCPSGFTVEWLGDHNEYDAPICSSKVSP